MKEVLIELREKPSFVWWGYQKLGAFLAAAKKPALHDSVRALIGTGHEG